MLKLSLLTVGVLTVATASQGAIVFSDDFSDNNRTSNPTWYSQIGSLNSSSLLVSGGVLTLTDTNGSNYYLGSGWSGSTFTQTGDKLTLTAVMKYGDAGLSVDGRSLEFIFAVGNDNGTSRTSDTTGTVIDDKGYLMALGGSATGATGSAILSDAGGSRWLGSNDLATITSGTVHAAETFKTFTLTITRNNLGNFDLAMTDGTTTISSLNQAPVTNTFNYVTFGAYLRNPINTLDVDSISVDFTPVPEPTTAAVLALGGVLIRRRR